jgi:hypothetical protein
MATILYSNLVKTIVLLKTSLIDGVPTPPHTGKANQKRGNQAMGRI